MKILNIRFKNLNSLTGEWQIDLTDPAYSSDGIFAITGPTGAGKTTIMDAICLALYGSTPRLDKVTKSSNEIMSRQTGECFAEVTFETQKGRYRCHWSQHRARKKPEGELQQAKHEIADADSGTVLESKINQVGKFIDNTTGMDFERFTRSMLLAQGGFTVFLKAPPNERAPILEQITGTEIYSLISVKIHERRSEEIEKLEILQAELKGIRVLSEDAARDLQTGLTEKQKQEINLAGKIKEMGKALTWIEGMVALEKELEELDKKQRDFDKRQETFAPGIKKLEKSRKALGLEGEYQGVTALRELQNSEKKELLGAAAMLPENEKACAEAFILRQTAVSLLNEVRARQLSESEVIKKVRERDTIMNEKKKQLEEKDMAIAVIEKQDGEYKNSLDKAKENLDKSQEVLKSVDDYQSKHAGDANLPTHLAAIAKTFESLIDVEGKHKEACKELSAAADKKAAAVEGRQKLESDHDKFRKKFEKEQNEYKRLTDEIVTILKGRDIIQWRSESDALKDRERLLVHAGEIIERIDKTEAELNDLKKNLETSKVGYDGLLNEIKTSADRKSILERDIENMETQISLLNRIRDLEEDRKRLEDGRPCPLCGATDHPYAQGNVPVVNEAEAELKRTKTEYKKASEKLGILENKQVKAAADIKYAEKELAEKRASLNTDEKKCADALSKLNIMASLEERAGKVREELAKIQVKITETSGIITIAEEKSKNEKLARTAMEKSRLKFDNSGKALQDAKHKFETAGLEHERLVRDCAILEKEIEKIRASALKDVKSFGIKDVSSNSLDDILKELTERKDTWKTKQDEKTVCEKKIGDLKAIIDREAALLAGLGKDLAARRKERGDLMGEYESLRSSRRELFGDKIPDQEEKSLADAVDKAGNALEKARREHEQIERDIIVLKGKIDLLKGNIDRRSVELERVEQNLKERIKGAGFEDEADYLSSRLSEEERELLAEKEQAILKEKTEIYGLRKDRSETLASEREKKLTDQSIETLKENISSCESDLKRIMVDIGGIRNILSEDEKQRETQNDRIKNIEAQKKECVRWDNLHQLIGSADGKKFRNFAQGLTFEMMTAHANRQLRKMTDRYLLIRDMSQPLELNVIDNCQAGEIRSTKNLSGGESFIVSLALALGLSQMASRNVRVDSLFLDEGFGTLDEDALETALETLAGLQQDGKLIGVISHVAALKERINTQIQVTPETGGRSSLSGPGCMRI
jgi:exonuclease SbcC